MKLTTLILITAILHVNANSFAQKITLSEKNAPLVKVFEQIRSQSGYDFMFSTTTLKDAKNVSIEVRNAELKDVLKIIFDGQPLEYTVNVQSVVVSKKEKTFMDRVIDHLIAIDVQGTVLDENGQPLPGATVKVKGTSVSAITNSDGIFQLKGLKADDQLIITFIGYKSKEISINKGGQLTIKMEVLSSELATVDIVNTGYQTITKERSAGSFARPDMKAVLNRTTSMNILQRLDGLVAGLTVNNSPNASANPILVRGLTTIGVTNVNGAYAGDGTNRNPLYVVDGIPLDDLSSINPQDVADINVLKDATAASIWGSRASNGVIIITTKKGTRNEKIKINYDGFVNFQGKPDFKAVPVLSSQQFIQAAKEIFTPAYFAAYPWATVSAYSPLSPTIGGISPHEQILYDKNRGIITDAIANSRLDSLASLNNTSQINDLWYRNAALVNHTLSLSGGGNVYSFYGSLANTNTISNRPGEKSNLYKINLRQDFTLNKNISLYLITDLTNTNTSSKRNINVDYNFYPYQMFRDPDGNNISMPYMTSLSEATRIAYQNSSKVNLNYNPLDEFDYGHTNNEGLLARITSGISLKLLKGLKFEGVYGYQKSNNKNNSFDSEKSYLVRGELAQFTVAPAGAAPTYYLPATGGRYTVSNVNQRNYTIRNQLIYDNVWKDGDHQLTLLAGQEAQEQLSTNNRTTVRGYNEDLQTSGLIDYAALSAGVVAPVYANTFGRSILSGNPYLQTEIQSRFTSYYANAAYTYHKKYALNGSWRIDQSNLFGTDKSAQNRPVWSIGGKWQMSSEEFMSAQKNWIDHLALRATYGITGISPNPGIASSFDIMGPNASTILPNGQGLTIFSPANKKLTWESTRTINLGIDFGVLHNRINGSIDLYQKKTEDLLGNYEVNGFNGYSFINGNMGSLENKGIELNIQSQNIQGRDFSWSSSFVMAYNKNMITKLNSRLPIVTGEQKIQQSYLPGYPAFAVFAYQFAGLDAMGDPQIRLADGSLTKKLTSTKPEDVIFMGTYQPVWNGGLGNNFTYKEFSLSMNTVFNFGNMMRTSPNQFYSNRLTQSSIFGSSLTSFGGNLNAGFAERWKNPGDEAFTNIPSYVPNTSESNTRRNISYYSQSDLNVADASYVKMRDITLSYKLPALLVKKIRAGEVSFRIQLSNVMLWKANKAGIDPEFGGRTAPVNQDAISLGAHITF